MTAAGHIYPEVRVEKTAVPVRDVNGVAVDSSGNLYVGSAGYSAIQVFDQEGHFLERICIPVYKAVSGSFAWRLEDGDRLVVYTFRDYDRLEIENGQAALTAHYEGRPAFEAAVEEAGLDLYDSGRTWQGSDGTVCRMDLLGRVHVDATGTGDCQYLPGGPSFSAAGPGVLDDRSVWHADDRVAGPDSGQSGGIPQQKAAAPSIRGCW